MSPRSPIRAEDVLPVLARRLVQGEVARLSAVYLFGSEARGAARADSDVDLAVLTPVLLDPVVVFETAQELASLLSRDVDLVDLGRANTVMRAQVVAKGSRIHTGDAVRAAEFEMYALSDYARLEEERRPVVEALLRRHGG